MEDFRAVAALATDKRPSPTDRHYLIRGGRELTGTVSVAAAKNAVNKQLVASLLTDEPCVFHRVPRIAEIEAILSMLSDIGTEYQWLNHDTLRLQTSSITSSGVSQRYSGYNRIPVLLLGPLLHRVGEADVPTVGGCPIGPRPLDFHVAALESMGATVDQHSNGIRASASHLTGSTIRLPFPSVGATETALFAAVLAVGTTVIENAATEPEIVDTILFLQKMGARVVVDVNRRIVIEGVERLHGSQHTPIPDRIEVASFAATAAATGGRITVAGAQHGHMTTFLNDFQKAGGGFTSDGESMTFFRQRELTAVHLETNVHPGFMTDWQQPFAVMLTQAKGTSVIHETVYENRFGYTNALVQMGAEIDLTEFCLGNVPCRFLNKGHSHSCIVRGVTRLAGSSITIPDLRAGFAYIIAALVASGETQVHGIEYLERGYARIPEKLAAIGADVHVQDDRVSRRAA